MCFLFSETDRWAHTSSGALHGDDVSGRGRMPRHLALSVHQDLSSPEEQKVLETKISLTYRVRREAIFTLKYSLMILRESDK